MIDAPASAAPLTDVGDRGLIGAVLASRWRYLAFFVLAGIVFLPFFTAGQVLFANTDLVFTHYPNVIFGYEVFRSGHLPLWNPLIFAGVDFSASMHNHFLNPIEWPLALVPEALLLPAITVKFWLEIALIGCFAAATIEAVIPDRALSLLLGATTQLYGFFWFTLTTYISPPAAMSSVISVYLLATLSRRDNLANFVWLTLALSGVLLAGHVAYIAGFGIPPLIVFFASIWPRGFVRPWRGITPVVIAAGLAAVAIAAYRVFPAVYALLYEGLAIAKGFWLTSQAGNTAYWFLTGFIPDVFGYQFSEASTFMVVLGSSGRNSQFHNMLYFGVAPMLIIFAALTGGTGRHARLGAWCFLFTSMAAVFASQPLADVLLLPMAPLLHDIVYRTAAAFFGALTVVLALRHMLAAPAEIGYPALRNFAVVAVVIVGMSCAAVAKFVYADADVPPEFRPLFLQVLRIAGGGCLVGAVALGWYLRPRLADYRRLTHAAGVLLLVLIVAPAIVLSRKTIGELSTATQLAVAGLTYAGAAGVWATGVLIIARTHEGALQTMGRAIGMVLMGGALLLLLAIIPQGTQQRDVFGLLMASAVGAAKFLFLSAVAIEIVARLQVSMRRPYALVVLIALLSIGDLLVVNKTYSHSGGEPFASKDELMPSWPGVPGDAAERNRADSTTPNGLRDGGFATVGKPGSPWSLGGIAPQVKERRFDDGHTAAAVTNTAADFANLFQDVELTRRRMFTVGVWVRASEPQRAGLYLGGPVVYHSGSGKWEFLTASRPRLGTALRVHLTVHGPGSAEFLAPRLVEGGLVLPRDDPPGAPDSVATSAAPLLTTEPDFVNYRANQPWMFSQDPFGPVHSNRNEAYDVPSYGGVDSDLPRNLYDFLAMFREPDNSWMVHGAILPTVENARALDLLGVKYDAGPGGGIIERPDALARLSLFTDYEAAPDHTAALARVKDPAFDPAMGLVLEDLPPDWPAVHWPQRFSPLRFEAKGTGHIEVPIRVDRPAIVLFDDSYSPGWRARYGGKTLPLVKANGNFMAIAVPAGEGTLVLDFRPEPFTTILPISLAAAGAVMLFGIGLIARGGYRRWRVYAGTAPSLRYGN